MDFGTNVLLSAGVVAGAMVAVAVVAVVVAVLVIFIIIITVTINIITSRTSPHTQVYLWTISWLVCRQPAPPL